MDGSIAIGGMMGGSSYAGRFSNPVLLPSSTYYPATLTAALDFCRYFYYTIPNFRQVQKRTVRYFVTEFEYPGDGDITEKEKLDKYLKDVLDLPQTMITMGDEWGCYGNAFVRFYYPFKRYLIDRRNGLNLYAIGMFDKYETQVVYNMANMTYTVPDPANDFKSNYTFEFVDFEDRDKNNLKLIIMDPRYIRMQYCDISKMVRYIYKFSPKSVGQVKNNEIPVINSIPRYMLEAMKDNNDIRFRDGEVFHFTSPLISGVSYSNWGMPELIANFRHIYQLMLYLKADEYTAMDFMMPFRLFSMAPGGGGEDVAQTLDASFFQAQIQTIIANRRKDPTLMHSVACPVNYQEFGANGKQFAPKELLQYQNEQLLNGCGFPVELFQCSLQTQQYPTALRIFQNNFWFIYNNYNKFVKWVVKKVQDFSGEGMIEVNLQEPKLADNLENTNILMQLVMSGIVPYDKVFKNLGISDAVAAMVRRREQDMEVEEETQKKQEEMEKKQLAQQMLMQDQEGGGGAPAGGGGMPVTDRYQQAAAMADQWLRMPVGQRREAMQALEAQDVELYALAKQIMEQQRSQMQSMGAQQMKEQAGYAS